MKKSTVSLIAALMLMLTMFSGCFGSDNEVVSDGDVVSPADDFVPLAVRPDEMGNTTGNHSNGSYVTSQGNVVYYSITHGDNAGIYKSDGRETTPLTGIPGNSLNAVGSYLYFKTYEDYKLSLGDSIVYKVRTDGGGEPQEILRDTKLEYVQVIGETIYYLKSGGKICRAKDDGTDEKELVSDNVSLFTPFIAYPGGIFYTTLDTSGKSWKANLCRMNLDGSGNKVLIKDEMAQVMALVNDNLYILHGTPSMTLSPNYIIYVNPETGTRRATLSGFKTYEFNAADNGVYYVDIDRKEGRKLRGANLSGYDKMTISQKGEQVYDINVVGDWVYYAAYNPGYGFFRVKPDGTGYEKLM